MRLFATIVFIFIACGKSDPSPAPITEFEGISIKEIHSGCTGFPWLIKLRKYGSSDPFDTVMTNSLPSICKIPNKHFCFNIEDSALVHYICIGAIQKYPGITLENIIPLKE